MNPRRCTSCGSGAEADASFCWLCGYPVGTEESPAPPVAHVTASPPLDGTVWILGFVLALLVMLGVAVELALIWPGLLVPYAVVLVPVVVVMARIVYVQRLDFWRPTQTSPRPPTAPVTGDAVAVADTSNRGDGRGATGKGGGGDVVGEVVSAVAIGLAGALVVIGLLGLLALAAFIILMALCFGILAAYGV